MENQHNDRGDSTVRPAPILEADRISFSFRGGPPVVRHVSVRLERGTLTALIGGNGAGKSTLLRLLGGFLEPAGGVIRLNGMPLPRIKRRERARILAYVPQSAELAFPFTALEVAVSGRCPHGGNFLFEGRKDIARALEALEQVGVAAAACRPVQDLSGGERQLVQLARALVQDPACLLMDEPSGNLDLKHRARLIALLRRLKDQKAASILMVTHDLAQLDTSAFDRVIAMHAGSVIAEGSPSEVLQQPVLAQVYADPGIQAFSLHGRTFVWSEGERQLASGSSQCADGDFQ